MILAFWSFHFPAKLRCKIRVIFQAPSKTTFLDLPAAFRCQQVAVLIFLERFGHPPEFERPPKSIQIVEVTAKLFKIESLGLTLLRTFLRSPLPSASGHHFGWFLMHLWEPQIPFSCFSLNWSPIFEPKITNRAQHQHREKRSDGRARKTPIGLSCCKAGTPRHPRCLLD